MIESVVFAAVFAAALAVLLLPRLRNSDTWDATVTPLASIIGSGFLVSAPLLADVLGDLSLFAMAGLIALAYLIGGAIRFNIAHAEPLLARGAPMPIRTAEQVSHIVLAFAYFVSVAYYLALLSTFLLKGLGHPDPWLARLITTAILLAIGAVGALRGLHEVEKIETFTVATNLAVIAGLLAALAWFNGAQLAAGAWALDTSRPPVTLQTALVVLGLLIVVQGFETSRFLGQEYTARMRVRTMRRAQLISAAIYLLFFALITELFRHGLHRGGVAAIIDMMAPVALVLPAMLTLGAVASQFSASVADSIGAAGLIEEISAHRVSLRRAYPIVAGVAIAVTWATDVFGIINLASRAFALFYAAQCVVAVFVAWRHPALRLRWLHLLAYAGGALVCLAVVLFAVPSGA